MVKLNLLRSAFYQFDVQGVCTGKASAPADVVQLTGLYQLAQSTGHFSYHAIFVCAELVQVYGGFPKLNAPVVSFFAFVEQFSHVQQRLRWNAAAIEADAAGIGFWINQRHVQAEVGGLECGHIASGAATDDNQLCFMHGSISPLECDKRIVQRVADPAQEARTVGAVNQSMVVAER